ncbi:MAG: hypothetical protein JSV62_00650 [Promethearchaeota archaeon]|nr:MAG: hypothetical protein JSV62_00650 [Candidatus Lokiarchaeota archaeon]
MLYKSKINLSVILIIIGIGLVPTGVFLKGYVTDQVSSEVSSFLENMEGDLIEEIEENYLGLGISSVLPAIYPRKFSELQNNYALVYGIPSTLLYLQNVTIEGLPKLINASNSAQIISSTIISVRDTNSTSITYARNAFFNNYTLQDDFKTDIEGISERMLGTKSLNYTAEAIVYLLNGREYDNVEYPGLVPEGQYGIQLSEWLEFYNDAKANISGSRELMETVYNCSWSSGQLQNLSKYITSYLWDVYVKNMYAPLDIETYADVFFYDQWANASWDLAGLDLMYFTDIFNESTYGLEVGRNNPTYINYTSAINLWDPLNTSSFVNDIGILKWHDAIKGNLTTQSELQDLFDLNDFAMSRLFYWLNSRVRTELVPLVFTQPEPIGIGMSISDYTRNIYLEQWANGTHVEGGLTFNYYQTRIVRPNGDNETSWSYPTTGNHYVNIDEVITRPTVGTPDYIATRDGDSGATETFDMTTLSIPSSGRVTEIVLWIYGYDIDGTYDMTADVNMNGWQGAQNVTLGNTSAWHSVLFSIDEENGTGAHLNNLLVRFTAASNIGFIQNHYISTMYARVSYAIEVTGFEAGIPIKTNISLNTARSLLDPSNSSSFIDRTGILRWIDAYNGNLTAQSELMAKFELDLDQLNHLNNWLFTTFRYDVVPLISYDYTNTRTPDFARYEFYRQWSDGILYRDGLNLDSFLGFEPFGGWEIGIPVKAYINESIAEKLWDDSPFQQPYSFVDFKGISVWFNALKDVSAYNFLMITFELTTSQMDQILDWLVSCRETYVVPYLQIQAGIPTDHYIYANTLSFGFIIAGFVIIGIGALGVVTLLILKRK